MTEITVKAYAKLNLTLDILRRREDGYHDLRMVMQSISLHDTVCLRRTDTGNISLNSNDPYLPLDRSNLAYRAAEAFFEAVQMENPGLRISIDKRIPVCAGMAGGSTDAAAVLRGLRELYCPEMDMAFLCRIGARVGSDVPYCVFGGSALAEGRGERLTRLAPLPECWMVTSKPAFAIPTPELFAQVDLKRVTRHPDNRGMLRSIACGDLSGISHRIYNVFEEVLPEKYGAVFDIKNRLLDLGAQSACMTGSGPTVFGVFSEYGKAEHAYAQLLRDYPQTCLSSVINEEPVEAALYDSRCVNV